MGLERWNQEREDAPEEFKKQKVEAEAQTEEAPKKKRGRKPKSEDTPAEE